MVHDVINLHLVEMQLDNFIAGAWEDHLSRSRDIACDAIQRVEDEEERRSLPEMAGTFLIHLAVSIVAILMAIATKCFSNTKKGQGNKRTTLEKNESLKSVISYSTNDPLDAHAQREAEKTENAFMMEHMIRREMEMEETLRRRQDEMEDRLQQQMQAIVGLLKETKNKLDSTAPGVLINDTPEDLYDIY